MKPKQKELHYYIYLDKVNDEELPESFLSEDMQAKIIKAVCELPQPCNAILEDYYYNNKPCREIIQQSGISRNKFYNHLEKGKFLLRQKLNVTYYDKAKAMIQGNQ